VACYGILNEVDHLRSPHSPREIAIATREFSMVVHSVDPKFLVVSPAIGGTPMDIKRADLFLKELKPLVDSGAINVLNLHSYHDSKSKKPHFSCIDSASTWAPSRNFLRAIEVGGYEKPVRFAAGEFNYRNWDGPDEQRAIGFMTTLWDQLMVVDERSSAGDRVGLFSIPYNISDDRANRQTCMSEKFEWKNQETAHWVPNEKGRVFRDNLAIVKDMRFVKCDPHETGTAVLLSDRRKVWVWQNRPTFSSLSSLASIELSGIPSNGKELKIIRFDSTLAAPWKIIPLNGNGKLRFRTSDLPSNQTILFVVDSADQGKIGGIAP
jgi:hypothetical protein